MRTKLPSLDSPSLKLERNVKLFAWLREIFWVGFFYLEFCESCKTFWLNVLANTTGCPKSINFPYSRKTMNDNEKCLLLLSAATIVVCHSLQFESTTINCCTPELGTDCTDVDELDQMCVTSHKLKKPKRNLLRGIVRCALPLPQTIVSCFVGLTKSKFLCYFKRIAIRLPSLRTSFYVKAFLTTFYSFIGIVNL